MVLVLFDEKENKLKIQHPIILSHESKKEVEDKIVHISTEKTDSLYLLKNKKLKFL